MDFSVKVEGLDRLSAKSKIFAEIARKEVAAALYASAKKVEADAKKSIQSGQKSGRTYQKTNPKRTHKASAPGEAPASDTGRLVNSINSYLATTSLTGFVVAGRGAVKYAAMLEFGTPKIAPRPFLNPALDANKDWINKRMETAMNRAIEKSSKR